MYAQTWVRQLAGEWRGRGTSDFPTIERAEYTDELDIAWDSGREVFCYEQRAVLANDEPTHRESGFISVGEDGIVEMWNAQNNGRTEVLRGSSTWDEAKRELQIDIRSVGFGNDPRMIQSRRLMTFSGDGLRYEMSMATTTTPEPDFLPHLSSQLTRGEHA